MSTIVKNEKAMAHHSSTLAWKIPGTEEPGGLQSMGLLRVGHDWATSLSLFTFHALEKEMATHSSILAWRIPGTGERGGLPSMGLHRVGHGWSDLAAAISHCAFNLHFPDNYWYWASFHMVTGHLYIFLCENSVKSFAHFLVGLFIFFLLSCRDISYKTIKSFIKYMYFKYMNCRALFMFCLFIF